MTGILPVEVGVPQERCIFSLFRADVASLPQARPFEAPMNEYNVRKARKGNNNASSRLQMTATATQQAEQRATHTQEEMLAAEQRAMGPEVFVAVATATTRGGRARGARAGGRSRGARARGGGRGGILAQRRHKVQAKVMPCL
ncbi:uncharacterized protein MYCGRDRAFT_97658 [Zymoseptoria tritici IPO323]|uniref:Uncharacterized protein n=1 Tax=Zymoseptoria tritici (strain CBS 115943 / IPO323) TaxID=336722 RepID=F9XQW9_ZYMTI|nr:uncharacterized protein MYCGRDRAFT_97658 [Zymoseptoria tritici IPO323]EGP82305.1 hypothetical protein MYCGRDRAFT_97658 [Zymoseptoria tritici IPO323]